ncbi:hypothetical protein TWF569_009167 [Orbilia oligospora]|uniref:HNH nuclease domain-containing protein n=1 Tax=Orbilia oligospora TaxID=2813651 RepID=A0A7C8J013_ORBOL|nr:hypothetical protein TWF102_002577 [Orbilia oligospora]KAF3100237.1 hypothetical protein TWF103_008262 [Orbilia oligospora]KAF3137726.1 hypothetical protein TWF569_009167 [Orbilia oligospora]KAF3145787.1 hypothetical protein TWF594_003774 [Orbilia oligospora]
MSANRRAGRTVFFFLSSQPNDCIGGCRHNTFTQDDLYVFVDILVLVQVPDAEAGSLPDGRAFEIHMRGSQTALEKSTDISLSPGDYIITPKHPLATICVSDELYIDRVLSHSVTPRDSAFRNALRQRDRGCVITGVVNDDDDNDWTGMEAAHIWPLGKGSEWIRQNASRWITDSDSDGFSNELKMNSPQNGILVSSIAHTLFDSYTLAINPEAGYRIYDFGRNKFGYGGKFMSATARQSNNNNNGARDTLLLWHFRQCVLANMRGAGEPLWDYSPREEGDVVGRLLSSDHTMTRLGEEVEARLALTSYLPSPSLTNDQ